MQHFRILLLITVVIVVSSCSEEANEHSQRGAYFLTASENYDDRFEFIAFITDENGDVLDQEKIKPGQRAALYSPKDYTGVVNFHYASRMTLSNAYDYRIATIPNVSAGWETKLVVGETIPVPPNIHALEVFDIPADYDIMRHAGPTVRQQTSFVSDINSVSQLFFSAYESGPITYILQTGNSGSPKYFQIEEPNPDETEQVNFSEFNSADNFALSIDTEADDISVSIYALFPGGKTSALGTYRASNTSNIDLYYYPDAIFPAYRTSIQATINNLTFGYSKYGGRLSTMKWMDAEISTLSLADNMLTANVSGTFDDFFVSGDTRWVNGDVSYFIYWSVDMKEQPAQSIVLPNVLQILEEHWGEIPSASIALEHGQLTQNNVENYVGENLWISKPID